MAENKLADLSMDFAVSILKVTDGIKGHYSLICFANVKYSLARMWANFISHRLVEVE